MPERAPFARNWPAFEAWLGSLGMFHMRLGLDRMKKAMSMLGLERPPFTAAQVLGTNGKGSTSVFLERLARSNGLKTGLFTSPHFLSCRERILINGRPVAREVWLEAAGELAEALGSSPDLTYFEFLAALAMLIFRSAGVEAAVFEAGLGGRNDATTSIPVQAQALTPVAMDHAAVIGPGIVDIARDKLDAKRCQAFFSGPQFPQVEKLALEAGARMAAPLAAQHAPALAGSRQRGNFALACAVWQAWARERGFEHKPESLKEAASDAFLPGRLQFAHGPATFILDGAHNPHALANLVGELDALRVKPEAVLFSCLADKDWRPGLGRLLKAWPKARFLAVQLDNPRAERAVAIAGWAKGRMEPVCGSGALPRALELVSGATPALLAGSFYLLAEFYKLFPEHLRHWRCDA